MIARGRRAVPRCMAACGLAAMAGVAGASETAPLAVPVNPVSFWSLLQVVLALVLVLGAIAGFAWFMRRVAPGQGTAGGLLKVVGAVMVGPKERLVVVEMGDTWLLVGVAANGVNLVHSLPKPPGAPASVPADRPFSRLLGQALRPRPPET
jgi:flagellar protein FliO/FliZ